MTAPLPRRVLHAKGDVDKLNEMATNTSYDTFNYLKELGARAATLEAEVAALTTALSGKVSATITDYSAKASPVGADQTYIADSAAGNAIKRATLTSLFAAVAPATGNPYVDTPASPNAFDDEFKSGSNDLSTRGYTVKTSGGTTLTRGGDIQPWNTTGPTGNTYWSRLTGSFILIQIPVSTTVYIFKSITLSAGDTYWARVGSNYRYDSSGSANFQEVGFYADSGGKPDSNNRAYVSHYETATNMNCDMAVSKGGAVTGTSRAIYSQHDIRGIRYLSGNDYFPFSVDSANGQSLNIHPASGSSPTAANLVYFAVQFTAPAGGNTPNIHSIDFIRKSTSDAWIAP